MKDVRQEKYLNYLTHMRNARNRAVKNRSAGYLDGIRYSEHIHIVLHFLFLTGSIDYDEFKKLEARFRVRSKDIRKYVYCADFLFEEFQGSNIEIET